MDTVHILEIGMLIAFGFSWPFNISKSIRTRTAKGKSMLFECIVIVGYSLGVIAKLITYVRTGILPIPTWFYFLDITLVSIDLTLTYRNYKREKEEERQAAVGAEP